MFKEREEKFKAKTGIERTEILYDSDNIVKRTINDFHKIKQQLDNCTDSTGPSVFFNTLIWKEFINLKKRGIKLRFITEITKDNVVHCKELMKITDLRHLDGVKGNFGIADGKDYGGSASVKEGQPPVELIRSNVKTFVDQQQFFFETLWSKATPAEQKIKEIEEGIEPIQTKVLENLDEINAHLKKTITRSQGRLICSSMGGMQLVYNNFFNMYKDIVKRQKIGEGDGIKWLTFIDDNKDNIDIIKKFLDTGIQVRHIKNLPSMNFSVDSKSIQATIERLDKGGIINRLLVSNEAAYINHFTSFFQELWDNQGINAADRIENIEQGMDYDIEVIRHSSRTWDLYVDIIKSAQSEIFFIFPTSKAFTRQLRAIYLAKLVSRDRNAKVRILTPNNELVEESIKRLLDEEKEIQENENIVNQKILDLDIDSFLKSDIEIRFIEKMSNTKATIVVVDRKHFLVMELKDDAKDTFIEAIGQSIHSTSKAGVLSYVAIFENLWKQSELYYEIKESNEKLKINDKMQREFINTAAHELRTPLQPIISLSSLLKDKTKDEEQKELLDIIIKNARRLKKLTEDILDVTKIEGNTLHLNKEEFCIGSLLQSIIIEFEGCLENNRAIRFDLQFKNIDPNLIVVVVDQNRISQVISNLINNSIKFISKEDGNEYTDGLISINVEKIRTVDGNNNNTNTEVIINIKDNGEGIDSEIYPRLFTKFASKSFQGTGLGLFISKNIIEAHGGRIWAKNNEEGKGATFSFSLPLVKQHLENSFL